MNKTPATDAMWQAFCAATGVTGDYVAERFGDSPEMADELIGLVLAGTKRATAGLARYYAPHTNEPLPKVGDHVVACDGQGTPRCIWRTTDLRIGPFDSVDAAFAWDEGEGDRTLAWWRDAHRRFFERAAAQEGFAFHDGITTIFERFTIVWPLEVSDDRAPRG